MSGLPEFSPGHRQHAEIPARKHGIQPIFVFLQATISGFCVAELALDYAKGIKVTLLCDNATMKALIDNFGVDVDTKPVDSTHFKANVFACASPTFYRWVFGWNGAMKITGPANVVDEYREMLQKALNM